MKVADLLDILKITKQSLGRVLKQLVDQGYVVQKEGANDRRQRLLYVTPKGEALALKLAGLQTARIARALAELGPARTRRRAASSPRMIDRRRPRRRAAADRARRPRAASARLSDARPWQPAGAQPPTSADDAPHLLVVDDDRRIRDLLSRFLTAEGYRVTTAEIAAEARAKLDGLSFDLLILDVMMPGETGFEFARRAAHVVDRADPDADRARRRREPHHRAWRSAPTTMSASRSSRANCRCASPASSSARSRRRRRRPEFVRFGQFVFHLGARRAAHAARRSST